MTDETNHHEHAAKKEVSAIGYSIVANVVDDVQMTFQHFVAADASDAQVNADLDRIMGLVARQRLILAEPKLRKELAELRASIKQYAADLEKVEADWQTAQEGLKTQIADLQAMGEKAFQAGYDEHVKAGRAGEYKPRGSTEQRIRAAAADVAKLTQAMETNIAERGQARQQLEIAMRAREGRMAMIEDQLAEIAAAKGD